MPLGQTISSVDLDGQTFDQLFQSLALLRQHEFLRWAGHTQEPTQNARLNSFFTVLKCKRFVCIQKFITARSTPIHSINSGQHINVQ